MESQKNCSFGSALDQTYSNNICNLTNFTSSITVEPNLWCLALVLFPLTCVLGNILVVLAVLSERSLQNSTNFLLVSLAGADLCIGTLVMPFSIYLTINRLQWYLPETICNLFCVVDVSASTSSIVHLVAISIDRFYAVVRHMDYKSPRHKKRIYGTILFCWAFSIGIGLPLGIGLNRRASKDEHECGIVNPDYMLYSSIFAFYIPCLVMTIMYSFVFYKLHRRMKAVRLQEMAAGQMVQFGDNLGNILQHAYGNKDNLRQASMIWAIPFLKTLEATIADDEEMSTEELNELTTILQSLESDPHQRAIIAKTMEGIPESPENSAAHSSAMSRVDSAINGLLMPKTSNLPCRQSRITTVLYSMTAGGRRKRRRNRVRKPILRQTTSSSTAPSKLVAILTAIAEKSQGTNNANSDETGSNDEGSTKSQSDSERSRRRQSLFIAKQKIRTLKERAIDILMKMKSKQGMVIRKETRATKLVSTVMLAFLICWIPFFTLNIIKVSNLRAGTWTYELESLFIFFTWLGYLNSCLNPLIYSLFNRKFRATFRKLLCCSSDDQSSPLRRRRLYSRPFTGNALENKRCSLPLARRYNSSSPQKKSTQRWLAADGAIPKNGALTATLSLPPPDPPPPIEAPPLPVVKSETNEVLIQQKIIWGNEMTKIDEASELKTSEPTAAENTTHMVETKSQDPMNCEKNGIDIAMLRKIQNSRCCEQNLNQNQDFTEPVEV